MTEPVGSELAEALGELRLYLSDQLAPLMVADSLQLLALQPPELAAREIHGWLSDQYQGPHASVPMSDYLFHALKKIHVVGEMKLVPAEILEAYFERLSALLLELCPEEDRQMLRGNIARIGFSGPSASTPVSTLYRQAGSETPLAAARPAGSATPQAISDVSEALRRFHLLLTSLGPAGAGAPSRPAQLAPELITAAASGSRDAQELDSLLKTLRGAGIDVTGKQLFRALSKKLPDWVAPPAKSSAEDPADSSGGITGAIRRVISLAPDRTEALTRFRELVETAVEAANEGSLSRAVTMVELAQKILEREKLDAAAAASFRERVHTALDLERLRAWTEKPDKRATLRRFLVFFPRLRPRGLMDALRAEKKRDMRRLWLALLEAHGNAAREEVLHELESLALGGDSDWYYQRNLLYAARRIPRSDQRFLEAEAGLFERLSDPSLPPPVVKEAVANLGQLRSERAEAVLVSRLKVFEARLARPQTIGREREELTQVLDRIAAALGKIGTPAAARAIVDRALRATPGASPAWLSHLSGQDLSGAPDAVEAILKALRTALPLKLFGLSRKAASPHVPHLIAALASTPSPGVKAALEDIAQRFADREVGHLAAKALEAPAAAAAAASQTSSLTGDLELFGLPSLLQTFDQNEATGVLVLRNTGGGVVGSVALERGKLRRASAGSLSGAEAVYQLLQRPVAGSFSFTQKPQLTPDDGPLQEPASLVPLVLEGMRRYDELERAAALVPDDVPLRPTRVKPTPHGAERDPIVLRSVWDRAASGATAAECEKAARADAYRVRRMLVHWVEEGSLEPEGRALAS